METAVLARRARGKAGSLVPYLPAGVDADNLVLVLDYKEDRYKSGGLAKTSAEVQTYLRAGVTWVWKMVAGSLELVEVAEDVLPFSDSPITGQPIGLDIIPAVTRSNIRYAPTASQFTTSGGGVVDRSRNVFGQFPSVLAYSSGSLADTISTDAADDVTLTSGVNYSFSIYLSQAEVTPSSVIRFGMQGVSGNQCYAEFTFATAALTNPVITGGTFSDLKADLLVDGTYRITGMFTPAASEEYRLDLLPYSTTPAAGFYMAAWFIHYWSGQQRGFPTPVLGPQGSTNATSKPSRSDGLLAVTGDRTVIITYRRDIKYSNWDATLEWRGAAGIISCGNRHDFKNYPFINDGTNPVLSKITAVQWGERTTVAISYEDGVVARFALYDAISGVVYAANTGTLALDAAVDFFIGKQKVGDAVIGGNYESVLFFDLAMTQAQIEEAVQRGV